MELALPIIGLAASAASTVVGYIGTQKQAEAAEQEAAFRAKQLEQKANEDRAAGQRLMFDKRRQTELAQSSLMARAASSGGDTTDAGILNLSSDIAEEGEFQALTEFSKGENAARGYNDAASATRATGKSRAEGYRLKGIGTLLEGATSFADKYSKAKPFG